ncbi:LamG-like jellyroll fold domain-containing protein [Haloferula sp. BvORR071]|uniref:LamG-like jellyroll fold domain-containing protein n=1 Tax=Haloferula sp. BvORR071 TaxID=1396141 RepID=UPI0005593E2E|nr:LamG-like jellyroll fold domain-containing protein [Haloferula sp. BvORR071]
MMAKLLQSRCLHIAGLYLLSLAPCHAEAPAALTRTISTGTESVTVDFAYHPIRSTNFSVLVQDSTGAFTARTPLEARTYLGTVQGKPGAIAAGLIRADGSFLCRISFESGVEWSSTGGTATIRGSTDWIPAWPTAMVDPGGAGAVVRAAEVGVDATYREYVACGSNIDATVEMAEFCLMATDMIYLRDAALLHRIGQVLVRTDATADPYEPDGGDTGLLLPHIRTIWNAGAPIGTTHDLALVARPGAGGGLAYVGTIGTSSRYSADGTDANGDFTVIWRHEAGHNWGSNHYEGGGKPEGPTIMSDNSLSRFSSAELSKIIAHRNTKTSVLDSLGAYTFPLPPRANMDRAVFLNGGSVPIDVLANDSDSNGDAISLASFPTTSALGGKLTRSVGTGPAGRDQILYTPGPADITGETDYFSYQIADAGGKTATGYAVVRPVADALLPVDQWKLDETSGTTAVNAIRSLNGTHQNGAVVGEPGSNAVTGRGVYYDGSNDRTSISAPNYNTATLSFTAWIKRDGTQNPWAPVVFTRGGSSVAGFGFGDANELRYQWNDSGSTFTPSPALTVPDGKWCLVSMAVSPTGVSLFLRTPAGLQSATHSTPITSEAFNSTFYLGRDSLNTSRHYKGWMDDVRTYAATLTAEQIESLYQQAEHPPEISVSAPLAGASVPALDLGLSAQLNNAAGYQIEGVDFSEGSELFGTAIAPPYSLTIPAIHAGLHSVTARASFGDWGYSISSAPVAFTVLPPPLPVVSVSSLGVPSRSGPIAADFVITRSHPLGDVTVPFTISGTAVSGTDYQALPANVSFPDGTLTKTVTLTPIAAAPQATKTVVLGLTGTADFTTGAPASATLTIDDHPTSIMAGAWNLATTWTTGVAAPVTGTQNSGEDYAVRHVVSSNNNASNSQALIGRTLRIENGGILDLARLHATTNQNVSYSLPPVTLESGGAIQVRASVGSSTHTIPASITNKGIGTFRINGGSYANAAILTGAFSGSGRLDLISDTNSGSVSGDLRQLSVNSVNNAFTGDWTVTHTADGDDFVVLRAGASRALGSGSVRLGTRARLVNDASGGLDSLSGVVMDGLQSRLDLNQRWNQPSASLALAGGSPEVKLGNAESIIGNLSGSKGSIYGTGSSSALTVQQTTAGVFSGALGSPLKFTKGGAAALRLGGAIAPAVQLVLQAGDLDLAATPLSVASLNQSGGNLLLDLGSTSVAPLTVTGNYSRSAGGIVVRSNSVPATGVAYPLVAYQGSMASPPTVTFVGPAGTGLSMSVQPGTGANSLLTVTFAPADPFPAWVAGFGLTGNDALPAADPDQDGVGNREEMLLGFDPTWRNSRLVLSVKDLSPTEATLSLNRVVTVGSFTLQAAEDPNGPWTSTPVPVSADENNHEITVPRIGTNRYFRAVYIAP